MFLRSQLAVVLALIVSLLASTAAPVASPPPAYAPESLVAIRPELRADVARALPAGLPEYRIRATIPPLPTDPTLHGTERVTYTNTTPTPLTELPFRLYANTADDGGQVSRIDAVASGGKDLPLTMSAGNSVGIVSLPTTLAPGDQITLEITFTTVIPIDQSFAWGILNWDSGSRILALTEWYPVIAPYEELRGWMLDEPTRYGDPIFTEMALFTLTLTAPDTLVLATSGVETNRTSADGQQTVTYNAWPSRDLAVYASASFTSVSSTVDGTTIVSLAPVELAPARDLALSWSAEALALFNDLLGDYPWRQLVIVPSELYSASGSEFPQLITIGITLYRPDLPPRDISYTQLTVVHELLHQWFMNLVGNSPYADAFLDEGMVSYLSSATWFARSQSPEVGAAAMKLYIADPYAVGLSQGTVGIPALPTDSQPSMTDYVFAAYIRAPMGFQALNQAMGDDAFFAGLRAYVQQWRFGIAQPHDLYVRLAEAADQPVRPLWHAWFYDEVAPAAPS